MKISPHVRCTRHFWRSVVVAMGILLAASDVSAGPQLWLYPADAGPREGGHVVPPGAFTLVVENRSKETESNVASGVELVVAVEDPSLVSTLQLAVGDGDLVELDPNGQEFGIPPLPCSGRAMPRHGVYPAAYSLVSLGDLDGGQTVEIQVLVGGDDGLRVHFDAIAEGWKTTGQGPRCFDISNPAGHDVTVANSPGNQDACGRVRISKTAGTRYVDAGGVVEFVIEVANEGSCGLTEPVVTDFVPVIEEDGSAAFQWTGETDPAPNVIDDFTLQWPLDSPLPVGESRSIRLVVEFDNPLVDGMRVINRACIAAPELRKPRCASAGVMVGSVYGIEGPAGPGFWCHATRWVIEERRKIPVDEEDLLGWLELIDGESDVYSEFYPIYDGDDPGASIPAAAALLCSPQSAGGPADRLARHLLTLWLNVVSERLDPTLTLDELCWGDEIPPDDADLTLTVGDLLDDVDAGLAAAADDQQLGYWSEIVDAINNSRVPGEFGCTLPHSVVGRLRAGRPGGAKIMITDPGN